MKKLKSVINSALMVSILITSLFTTQIMGFSQAPGTFNQGDLICKTPNGETFYYAESNVKWDKKITSAEYSQNTTYTDTGNEQTIETVSQFTKSQLSMNGEKKYIEIIMQIPTVVICSNQLAMDTNIKIIKMGSSTLNIAWKKQIIKEANIIKLIGEYDENNDNNCDEDYKFKVQITYTGDYLTHVGSRIDSTFVNNVVLAEYYKVIKASQTRRVVETISVGSISDIVMLTRSSSENSKYRQISISKSCATTLLTEKNLKLELLKSNNEQLDLDGKCFNYEIIRNGENYSIKFWSASVTTTTVTSVKLRVTFTNSYNSQIKYERLFNVKVLDLSNDVN